MGETGNPAHELGGFVRVLGKRTVLTVRRNAPCKYKWIKNVRPVLGTGVTHPLSEAPAAGILCR